MPGRLMELLAGVGPPPLGQQICTWSAATQGSSRIILVSVIRTPDMDESLRDLAQAAFAKLGA